MNPSFYPLADVPVQPWKNGGGVTRELLIWPPSSKGTQDWQLRISVADITQNGPFSHFEGITRAFAVIEGAGVQLEFSDVWHTVTKDSESLIFEGVDAPDCKLIDGATRDLNVMCKHGRRTLLTRAYSGETATCMGLYSLQQGGLLWHDSQPSAPWSAPSTATFKTGAHIGWWIDFL